MIAQPMPSTPDADRTTAEAPSSNAIQTGFEPASKAVQTRRPAGTLDITEAARRATNNENYNGSRSPSAVRSWLHRLAAGVSDDQKAGVADGKVWLRPSLHPALCELPKHDIHAETVKYLNQRQRGKAFAKIRAIRNFREYCTRGEGRPVGRTVARRRFVETRREHYRYRVDGAECILRLSVGSLKRWARLHREGGADSVAKDGRGGGCADGPSDEAVQMYWYIRSDPRKQTIATCYRVVSLEAKTRGWRWFKSLNTLKAWDQRTRDSRALALNQKGDGHYAAKVGPYLELDSESFEPGECWVGDDHSLNAWVRLPGGKVVRPVLSTWQCWRSRAIVQNGSEHSLLSAFASGADQFGLPKTVIADNGKNFTSWQWRGDRPKYRTYRKTGELAEQTEGIFALCDITASWCLPYNPNGKARLERWFRTLDEQFCKTQPSYCGRCPDNRPEAHKKLIAKAVEWDVFAKQLARFVETYNATPHSGEGMDGRTPLQVMVLAPRKRVLDPNIKPMLLCSWHRPVMVQRNGVAIRITGTTVRYGATEPALQALAIKTRVRIGYDPNDVTSVQVWSMDYRWICRAESNQRFNRAVSGEALREAMRQRGRDKRTLRSARNVGLGRRTNPIQRSHDAQDVDAAELRHSLTPATRYGDNAYRTPLWRLTRLAAIKLLWPTRTATKSAASPTHTDFNDERIKICQKALKFKELERTRICA